jgi:PST family polysaccharide transporter
MAAGEPIGSTPAGPPPSLARTAAGGVAWQGVSLMLGKAATLVATVVLARLLTPAEFGLVGFALAFVVLAEYVSDLGVAQALVYFRGTRDEDAAFALAMASGAALCLAALAAAPAIAGFFGEPDVAPLVRLLSVALLAGAARQVPDALLRRDLLFRRRMVTEVARAVVQGAVSIGLAVAGAGAWAIAWGYLAGTVASAAVAWAAVAYRPGRGVLRPGRRAVRRLLGYGAPAAVQGLLAALIFDVDYLIVGKALGAEALGTYTLAFRLPQLLIVNVFFVLSAVAFPMFSRVRDDPSRLRRGYLTSIRLQSAYGLAAGAGLSVVAPMAVPVLLGPRWAAAVGPLEALALYAAARSLGAGAVDVYKGTGRPGLAAAIAAVRLAVLVPALLIAVDGGIGAVAWTQAGLALVFAAGMQVVAMRTVGVTLAELAAAMRPGVALACGAVLGAGAVRLALDGPVGLRLAAALGAGAVVAVAALWVVDAQFVREVRALLRRPARAPAVAAT